MSFGVCFASISILDFDVFKISTMSDLSRIIDIQRVHKYTYSWGNIEISAQKISMKLRVVANWKSKNKNKVSAKHLTADVFHTLRSKMFKIYINSKLVLCGSKIIFR